MNHLTPWMLKDRLRERGVPESLASHCSSLAASVTELRLRVQQLEKYVEFLRQHVPEEIRNPPKPVPIKARRYHGD